MKRLISLALGSLLSLGALAAGNDLVITQRSSDDTANQPRLVSPAASDALVFINAASIRPERATLGAGCSITAGVFNCTGTGGSQIPSDWAQSNSGAADFIKNKPTLFSGAYSDLTGKPALFDGNWSSLAGKPTTLAAAGITDGVTSAVLSSALAGYATTSAVAAKADTSALSAYLTTSAAASTYATSSATTAALAGKEASITAGTTAQYWRGDKTWQPFPSIPAAQVNSDWNAGSGLAQILNKPSLAAVATSGSYADLSNKPTIQAIQRQRAQTNTSGVYTWTFPSAYGSGITPVVGITVEDSSSATWNHQITAISNTAVTIQLTKTTAVTVLGISVLGVAATPQAYVHVTAVAP